MQDVEAAVGEDQRSCQRGYPGGELRGVLDDFLFAPFQGVYSRSPAVHTEIRLPPVAGNRSDHIDNE
jgi:hypothetical protein